MTDHLTPAARSKNMAAVHSKDTEPELLVRSVAHKMGYRFRLHVADLPGAPDLVFPRHRKAVFVHGCFWHRHGQCRFASTPKTRTDFWEKKFKSNVERDRSVQRELQKLGWRVMVIWQCQLKQRGNLVKRLARFLSG